MLLMNNYGIVMLHTLNSFPNFTCNVFLIAVLKL